MAKDRLAEVLTRWEAVIGLEIHTELTTLEHARCSAAARSPSAGEPNTRVCPVCLGLPGALPVPNEQAVESTVLAGLATNCDIALLEPVPSQELLLSRHAEGLPDLPVRPAVLLGRASSTSTSRATAPRSASTASPPASRPTRTASTRRASGSRASTSKRTPARWSTSAAPRAASPARPHSLVDFNRAGTPLMELVSEPDIRTPEEARRFAAEAAADLPGARDLRLQHGGGLDARGRERVASARAGETGARDQGRGQEHELVQGAARRARLRDRPPGRPARRAAARSCRRRGTGTSAPSARRTLRSKEEAHDYRYFPEPDMVPFSFDDAYVERDRASACRSCRTRARSASSRDLGLPAHDAVAARRGPRARALLRGRGVRGRRGPREAGRQLGARRAVGLPQRRGDRRVRVRA